jgi:hypothetical protein
VISGLGVDIWNGFVDLLLVAGAIDGADGGGSVGVGYVEGISEILAGSKIGSEDCDDAVAGVAVGISIVSSSVGS